MNKDRLPIDGLENESWCGPACLKYVAAKNGIITSQMHIANLCTTTREWGTTHYGLQKGCDMLGLTCHPVQGFELWAIKGWTKSGVDVIVNWMAGPNINEDGHYSVVEEITDKDIVLQDPSSGGTRVTMTREEFDEKWFDVDERGITIKRWALLVNRKE